MSRTPQRTASLFDHLVGAGEHNRGDIKAERLGSFEIDQELEFRRLLYREFAGWSPSISYRRKQPHGDRWRQGRLHTT
jgi:hypothetical protein